MGTKRRSRTRATAPAGANRSRSSRSATARTSGGPSVGDHARDRARTTADPDELQRLQRDAGNQAVADHLQREVTDDDVAWARASAASVARVQDAVLAATDRLNDDARAAIADIRACQEQYDRFDELYDEATERFITGVEAAQAQSQAIRDAVVLAAKTAFAAAAPTAFAMYEAIDGALGKVSTVAGLVNVANTAGRTPTGTSTGTGAVAARGLGVVDWSELLTTTLDAFEGHVQNNEELTALSRRVIGLDRFLDSVRDRSFAGEARTSADAGEVDDLVAHAGEIERSLGRITEGAISGTTGQLRADIADRMGEVTGRSIEQDIAIRWMAGLGRSELTQIGDSASYLTRIGVTDAAGNRLGYEIGWISTDTDEHLLQWRAQAESQAQAMVGTTVTWMGNPFAAQLPSMPPANPLLGGQERCYEYDPMVYSGNIRDDDGREWRCDVPRGAPTDSGGTIFLTGYHVDHADMSDQNSYPSRLREQFRWEITFTGRAVGTLGGGAADYNPHQIRALD